MSETDSSVDSNHDGKKKKRKGILNTPSYKANVIKQAKVKGLPHKNHSGREIAARTTGTPCK